METCAIRILRGCVGILERFYMPSYSRPYEIFHNIGFRVQGLRSGGTANMGLIADCW